jgi:hypothetical protein
MNCLRWLECWDHEFESHSSYGCLCAFILALLFCVQAEVLQRADPPSRESYWLCMGLRNWKSGQDPTKWVQSHRKIERWVDWMKYVVCHITVGNKMEQYTVFTWRFGGRDRECYFLIEKRQSRIPGLRWDGNIKVELKQVDCGCVCWIQLVRFRVQ